MASFAKYRILVIEDNAEDRQVYRDLLCQSDECEYQFSDAETGKEGIELYRRYEFDCVLLDYQLPDMDGNRILEELRAQNKVGLPVVMVTGRGDERIAVRALKLGAADYIVKAHLTPEGMFRATQNAIEKHRTAVRLEDEHRKLVEALERETFALAEAKRERERLRMFFSHMPTPVAVLRGGRMVFEFTNEPMRELLGLENPEKSSRLRTLAEHLGGEVLEIAELVFKSGKAFTANEFEIERCWNGGPAARRYFNVVFEPLREHGDTTTGLIFVMSDITAQVQARQQVEESEQRAKEGEMRFRKIAEVVPFPIFVTDAEGSGEYFNSAWLSITGSTLEDNLGWHWLEQVHPDDLARVTSEWRESLTHGSMLETTCRLREADGEGRWHMARALPIHDDDGKVQKWYGAFADVHEQRMVTDILRSNEKRLALATSNSGVGIWEYNLTTGSIWRSSEHDQIFGFEAAAPRWDFETFIDSVLHEDRARVRETFEQARHLRRPFDMEFRVPWPNDSVQWINAKGSYERTAEGHDKYSGTVTNVTDLKKREQDLADARNYAVAANETKTAFLANMSHEIRTPLSAIMGFTELIAGNEISDEEKRTFVETVHRNSRSLMQIIDDILDLSKIEAGRLQIEMESMEVRKVVNDVVLLFQTKAAEKGIELKACYGEDIPTHVMTDPVRFRQILLNAVSNAVKFTPKGSVQIMVSRAETEPSAQSWLVFSIQDTGLGIADDHQSRLFQPFSQGDNSMTRRFGGTGLGLMLARRLAKLIGGAYYLARTKVGEGSTFELRVPFDERNLPAGSESEQVVRKLKVRQQSVALRGARLLLIEDSPDNRLLVKLYLERHGASVETAENGAEGLLKIQRSSYDLVITDIQMPIMDGYETTRKLRSLGFQKPIVGLTAHVFREDREKSLAAGIDAHLSKPVQAEALVSAVEELLSRG